MGEGCFAEKTISNVENTFTPTNVKRISVVENDDIRLLALPRPCAISNPVVFSLDTCATSFLQWRLRFGRCDLNLLVLQIIREILGDTEFTDLVELEQ